MPDTITLTVDFNNPLAAASKNFAVAFHPGMKIHDALLAAYDAYHTADSDFTFDLRYSGTTFGYFVQAMYGVPTTLSTSWKIFIGDALASRGAESVIEKPGEKITFRYDLDQHVTAA